MLLPVIDLQGGLVVRGVAGNRAEYRPVVSNLVSQPTPAAVATAFAEKLGATDVYVADLDAIAGADPDWQALEQIQQAGLKIWLDSGVYNANRAQMLVECARRSGSLTAIVIGLESVPDVETLRNVFTTVGGEHGVFSLDLKHGIPLTAAPGWQGRNPLEIATIAVEIGFRRLLVLDLAQVGGGEGPSVAGLCRELRAAFPRIELTAGGGVRCLEDVALLLGAGCQRVLVASALHSGALRAF